MRMVFWNALLCLFVGLFKPLMTPAAPKIKPVATKPNPTTLIKPLAKPSQPGLAPLKPLVKPNQPGLAPFKPLVKPNQPAANPVIVKPTTVKPVQRIFDKYLVIVLKNQHYDSVITDPYFKDLTSRGMLFTNFYALSHPSYPNYLGMVAGSYFQVTSNTQVNLLKNSVADLLEAKNLSWRNYAGDYPGGCYLGSSNSNGTYQRKHVPFLSFQSVQVNATRCKYVVPSYTFQTDWSSRKFPNYAFFTPNMKDDGHDTSVAYSSQWLKTFLEPLLSDSIGMQGTLIQITYDEAFPVTVGPNLIYNLLIGPMIKANQTIDTKYDHYSMLRTVEHNFNLGTLGLSDSSASIITELWAAATQAPILPSPLPPTM